MKIMKRIPWMACLLLVVSGGCRSTAPAVAAAGVEPEARPEAAAAAAAPAYKNTLKWTTASEVNNFGYDIYRGAAEEGPFERITSDPLPGAGTTDEPTSYVFEDITIDPTQGYWYYIESISMTGVREQFSPTTYIGPKAPKAE